MKRLPACLRETFGGVVEPDAARACLVWPTVNLNCHYDRCDGGTASMLRALPSWRGTARNPNPYPNPNPNPNPDPNPSPNFNSPCPYPYP